MKIKLSIVVVFFICLNKTAISQDSNSRNQKESSIQNHEITEKNYTQPLNTKKEASSTIFYDTNHNESNQKNDNPNTQYLDIKRTAPERLKTKRLEN